MSEDRNSEWCSCNDILSQAVETSGMGVWALAKGALRMDSRSNEIHGLVDSCCATQSLEKLFNVVHTDDRKRLRDVLCAKNPSSFRDLEYRLVPKNQRTTWVKLSGDAQNNPENGGEGFIGSCFDISEEKKVHRQLLQAQKMEAVGQLTAGIAHNFNNILSAILPSLHLVAPHVRPAGLKLIRNAQLAAERATELVAELMVVAGRKTGLAREPLDLVMIMERVVRICRTTFGAWVQLNLDKPFQIPPMLGCESQIEQVLLNLLLNARDAFEEGGTSCPSIDLDLDVEEDELVLRVMDNGPGMTSATTLRIFEPFFTTKGYGTGLGLATAYAIVGEHSGVIQCWSKPGRGTEFVLRFPVYRGGVEVSSQKSSLDLIGGTEKILVVEDDQLVRRVTSLALREAGYSVVEANGGEEALAMVDRLHNLDLVVLDLAMPQVSGDEVLMAMRKHNSSLKVLIFTGLSHPSVSHPLGVHVLQKPAGVNQLLQAVREALDSEPR